MIIYLEKFPSYEELKKLDKKDEYRYDFNWICGSCFLRLTYNEELNNKISLDYIEKGFLQNIFIYKADAKFSFNEFYSLNKQNYQLLIKHIKLFKEYVINNIKEMKI